MENGRLAAYAAGNKRYGGGRSNPTSGTVDPSGYVDRDNSNKRSGLAAAAGRRLQGNSQPQMQQGTSATEPYVPGSPITLADGRRLAPSVTGQYKWLPQPPVAPGVANGL